ncbi:MAG: BolA family protein [Burkholderiales bacterium]
MSTVKRIEERLASLAPQHVEIVDESAKHAGHAGARSGGGHFLLTIVSNGFSGKMTLARHHMVYDALGDLMQKEIHALSIRAHTPEEFVNG